MHLRSHSPSPSQLVCLALAISAGLASALPLVAAEAPSTSSAPAKHIGPRLAIASANHDFGTIAQGEPLHHDFQITNSGDEPLEITEVKPSCGCTTTGEWPHHLKPGESGIIPIKLDTGHFVGGVTKTITIKSNDAEHPESVLELKASVWTPIKVSAPVLIFPAITDPMQSTTRSVTIDNEVEAPLTLSELHCDLPQFKPELKEIVPGKQYELIVTTVPPLHEGTQSARITMRTSIEKMPEVSVQAVATVLPAIQVAPSELLFAARKLTASEKRFAVILNHRGADLHVSDLSTTAPGVELSGNISADRKQFTITLTFPAGFEIHPEDKFVLRGKTDQPSVPTFEIPIVYAGDR